MKIYLLLAFVFLLPSISATDSMYSDCSYGNCNIGKGNTINSFVLNANNSQYWNGTAYPNGFIQNNTYNGYNALLSKLGVDNYVGYDLGASGFNSVWGARDGSQCNGNYFDSCSGSATSCGEFFSDTSCQMQTGCYWDYDLGSCSGSPQACDTFSSESSCTQQLGCTANVLSCNGFTDQTSCETKAPECTWDLIPETYDLQYKSQNYFNFSRPIHATQVNFKTQVGAPFFTMNGLSFMEENSATLLEINRNTPYARLLFDTPSGAVFNLEYPWSRFYQSLIINNQLNVTGLAKFSSNITAPNICYSNGTGCLMDTDWIHNETTHVIYTNDSNDKVCIGSALQCANPSNMFLVNGGANITGMTYLDNVATFDSLTGNANFTNNVSALNFFGNLNASYIQNVPWLTTDDDSAYANKSANNIFTGSNNQFVSINGTGNITFPSTSSSLMLGTTSLSDGGIIFNHRISGSGGTVPQAPNTGILEITGVDGYTSGTSDSRSALYVSYAPSGSLTRGAVYGAKYQVDDQRASGTLTNLFGFYSQPNVATNAPGTVTTNFGGAFIWLRKTDSRGTVTNAYGTLLDPFNTAGTTAGNITNFYGYRILASGGTITNRWAFYQDGVNDRNFFAGNTSIGYTSQPTMIANLMVNKSAFIGNSNGNVTLNDNDGILLAGNATQWDDVSVPISGSKTETAKPPLFDETSMAYYFEKVGAGNEEYVFGAFEMPHSWKLGSDLHCHIHTHPSSTNVGNATFELNYTWTNIGAVEGSPTAINLNVQYNGTVGLVQIPEWNIINGTGKTLSSMFEFRLRRLSANVNDTFTGNAYVDSIGCHVEKDSIGSREELVK